jgi:RNA polymerase sigma factor (sigma-70 family)
MPIASPRSPDPSTEPRLWLEQHLSLVQHVVHQVARRRKLPHADVDELVSLVCERLVRDDYRALRAFRGQSRIGTYLTVLACRVLLDWQVALWGKWRPSARARRLGPAAIALERLVVRNGEPLASALAAVTAAGTGAALSEESAWGLVSRPGCNRRTFVAMDGLDLPAPTREDPCWLMLEGQRAQSKHRVMRRLAEAVDRLPAADRRLVQMRHREGLHVSQMADRLGTDRKQLYRRFERIHRTLRAWLETRGVSRVDATEALADAPPSEPLIERHHSGMTEPRRAWA